MKCHTKIFVFTICDGSVTGYVTIKEYVKIYGVNLQYLIFRYINRYFEEINENKYLTLVPTNESKEKIKKKMKICGLKSVI